jgi:hypothetical protein
MRSHDRTITTSKALASAIAAVFMALAVAACGQNELGPDPASCKAAMQAQYLKATAGEGHSGAAPAACKGLPKAEVQRFAVQIRTGQ